MDNPYDDQILMGFKVAVTVAAVKHYEWPILVYWSSITRMNATQMQT